LCCAWTASQCDVCACHIRYHANARLRCPHAVQMNVIKSGQKVTNVPRIISADEQRSLSIRWSLEAARKRASASKDKRIHECLAEELLAAYRQQGGARAKRDELHKLALENKGNVSTKWWA
jgi:small subunit ribosomal protein S7